MYHILLFSSSPALEQKIFQILSPLLKHRLWIETAALPNGPIAIFPKSVPSAFLLDMQSCPEENEYFPNENPWFHLLCTQSFLLDLCRSLTEMFPSSFCYYNQSAFLFLFVLCEPTGDFTRLEQNRQFLMDRQGIHPPFFSPFCFGIIHHDLSGFTSSFLEASEVYYMNRLQMPCAAFEEISSPPGQMLKPQKLMEIERSIRTDIQFREGENARPACCLGNKFPYANLRIKTPENYQKFSGAF